MNIKIIRVILLGWISASLIIPTFSLNIYLYNYNRSVSYEWDIQSLNTSQDEHHWKRTWNNGYLYDMEIDSEENIYLYGATLTPEYSLERCLLKYNLSGDLQWVKTWKNPSSGWGSPLTIDSLDNIYITGGAINQDTGYYGISLLKFHSNGTILFNKTLSAGGLYSEGLCIASDSLNNIYVGGYIENNLSENMYDVDIDAVLVKYNQSGDPLWSLTMGGDYDYQEFDQLEIDSNGNVYALYITQNPYYTDEFDAYVVKFSNNGTFQWSRLAEREIYFFYIALDSDDNIYFVKEVGGIEKVNSSGSRIWQRSLHGFNTDIVIDNQDNLYILGGYFFNQILFPDDMIYNSIKKYDNQGNLQWNMRGVESDIEYWQKIIVDRSENIYIGGVSWSETTDSGILLIKNPQLFEIEEPPGLYELTILIGLPIGLIAVIAVLILTTKRK